MLASTQLMAGRQRGHTTQPTAQAGAGEQLELTWEVPPASPATTDFVCWLWAAFPPRDGRLNVSRIAKDLQVSPTTLRRWIAKDDPKLQAEQINKLHRRAILRGHGHYLWPDLDPVSRRRSELVYADAVRNDELITREPDRVAPTWHENGTLSPHLVQVLHFPKAHAYGVSAATHEKAVAKVWRHATVIDSILVPNKFAAIALKQEILRRVDEHRCIAPRRLVPTGRTETWREAGGPTTIRRPLEISVIRFAGRGTSFARLSTSLHAGLPMARVTEFLAQDATAACEALAHPADVVILTSHAYTRSTWTARRPWPGGRSSHYFAGGRGPGESGMSLAELAGGLEQLGGVRAPYLILDVDHASATRSALRRQLRPHLATKGGGADAPATRVLVNGANRHGIPQTRDLVALLDQIDRRRDEDLDPVAAGTYLPL